VKGLLADCKHALRLYWRTPVASLIAIVVLAVGMAFVSAFLSLYVDLVLRPHPGIEQSGDIVSIGQSDGTRFTGVPIALIERMADEVSSLDAVVGIESTGLPIGPEGDNATVEVVTRGFFDGIRPRLALGRGFDRADYSADAEPVIVISDRYWREAFDADPDVLGETIEIVQQQTQRVVIVNGRPQMQQSEENEDTTIDFRIVGIMAAEFPGAMNDETDFWAPIERIIPFVLRGADYAQVRNQLGMRSLARLSRGASADAVIRELEARYPESTEDFTLQEGFRLDVVAGVVRNINVHRDAQKQLQLFLAGSVLLALVAAANVSLFLLARAPGRRRELAIRMSVGAPVRRLARQLASEAGLLVIVAAALGLLVSVWLVNFLRGLAFLQRAEWSNVSLLDPRVLTFIGAFLLVLTLLVSLAPILGLKRLGIASSSRQVAARATVAQRVAGTVQIAIAGTLGGAAIAFGWYLGSMALGYPGYAIENRYQVQFSAVPAARDGGAAPVVFGLAAGVDAERQREVVEALPGVRAISWSSLVPGAQSQVSTRPYRDPLDPTREIRVGFGTIDSRFVDVLGLRLLYGRAPEATEAGVALVNQALARRYYGRDDVVGESLDIPNDLSPSTEIVGVLEDLSFVHPAADVEPILFVSQPPSAFQLRGVVESALPGGELQQQLQGLIDSGELELGSPFLRSLADLRRQLLAPDIARSLLTIGTASLVVLLAAFGFYGTQRYLVTAGRREYAIRASLGAGPRALGRLVFGRGIMLSLPGLATGALLAFIVVAWLRDDFVSRDISPASVTLGVVAGLVLLLLVASLGPARQARRTQPAPLLRED